MSGSMVANVFGTSSVLGVLLNRQVVESTVERDAHSLKALGKKRGMYSPDRTSSSMCVPTKQALLWWYRERVFYCTYPIFRQISITVAVPAAAERGRRRFVLEFILSFSPALVVQIQQDVVLAVPPDWCS